LKYPLEQLSSIIDQKTSILAVPDTVRNQQFFQEYRMNTEKYDYIVIGGGSGGIASARRAAEYGADVLLIENGNLGGTCVNVGCVPKKVMWSASQIHETVSLAHQYGMPVTSGHLDWHKLKSSRDVYIHRLNGIYARNLETSGVNVKQGVARFVSPDSVEVNEERYSAEHVLISTGGQPSNPNLEGTELGIDSNGFFELEEQPSNLLVVGSGYIATELAGLMHGLGSQVTMALRKNRLLGAFDTDLQQTVLEHMEESGIEIIRNISLARLDGKRGNIEYEDTEGNARGGFDCVIWAIGRRPNTQSLNLENAGLSPNDRGFIDTDQFQNTAQSGIYAVGDVTPRAQLTPVAIAAGRKLSDRVFGGQKEARLDYSNIPTVVFSHPPVGTVGLTEAAAMDHFGKDSIKVYRNTFVDMYFALCEHKPRTLVKLIVEGPDERIVGCHVAGRGADEMIQGFAVAVRMGATKSDFDNTVAIHPTAAEELVTLRA